MTKQGRSAQAAHTIEEYTVHLDLWSSNAVQDEKGC
jgi:hypothetical protein